MPYLMCGYAAAILMMLLGCIVAHRTVPGMHGMKLLQGALSCGLIGVFLTAARPWTPAWASILLSNQILYAAFLLIYCSTAAILGTRMRFLPWGIALALLSLAPHAWYTWIHPALMPRILIASGQCALFSAMTALLLFRYRDTQSDPQLGGPRLEGVRFALGWLEMMVAAVNLARCVLTVLYPPADLVHMDVIQAGYTWLNLCLNVGSGCGLIWLALCVHRRDLHVMAQTDGLTGLLNRRAFEEILSRELRRTQAGGPPLAVLLLDIDFFKEVNDTHGHLAGDEVIRRVSETLRRRTRPADALARYGGEEFVMLLRECSVEHAEEIAERVRTEIASLRSLPGDLRITASIGIAGGWPHDTPDSLLARGDDALYGSKRNGRNLVTSHRPFPGSPDISIQTA